MSTELADIENNEELIDGIVVKCKKNGIFYKNNDTKIAIGKFLAKFLEMRRGISIIECRLQDNAIDDTGNNFCSVVARLRIFYLSQKRVESSKSVLLKIPSLSPNYHHMKQTNVYDKETYCYKILFPKLYKLWYDEDFSPFVYAATDTGVLILDDLIEDGYKAKNKLPQLDFEHSRIALQTLAKFHALSFKFLREGGDDLPEIMMRGSDMGDSFKQYIDELYDKFLQIILTTLSAETIDKLTNYKRIFWNNCERMMSPDNRDLCVIIHGDYWTCNLLFYYDNDDRLSKIKIVDWQICRKGSPAIDLIYFFTTSVQFSVYENNYETLIDSYLTAFNLTSKKLNENFVYTRAQLDDDLKKYQFVYVNLLSTGMQLLAANTTGVFDKQHSDKCLSETDTYSGLVSQWLTYLEQKRMI